MPRKALCVVLALVMLISLATLSSCITQNGIEDTSPTSSNAEDPPASNNTEQGTQNPPETQSDTQPDEQPENQPDEQPENQPDEQPENQPDEQPEQSSDTYTAPSLTKQSMTATDGSTLSYWLYTPENATDNMPLLIYLHGGSGKGDDLDILLQNGFPKFLCEGSLGNIPAYIVIPQVSSGMKGWTDIKNSVRELVHFCCESYAIDSNRVSLTGHSMGGTGTWNLALSFPSLFPV